MYTIVVADDEEELRRAIIRKIDWESTGFRVVGEAENGIEALELVERMEPDLLLTDIRMPFVSGIELARQVREVRPTTQIAFLSGFDEFSYAQQAIQYNIISYMLKPITMADLTEELKKIKLKIDGIFAEFDTRKNDNPNLQQFFLPLLLDDYVNFDSGEREEKLIEQAITDKTRAIVPVHYAGVACEMDTIMEIAGRHDLKVVEDAAQGVDAYYKGKALGTIGYFGCYSFHETKNYTMGEGGAILFNGEQYLEKAEILREKGTDRSKFFRGQVDKYRWMDYGSSYLPSELNAAYLYAQLEQHKKISDKRMQIYDFYNENLRFLAEEGKIQQPYVPEECTHNAHMYYIKVHDIQVRTRLLKYLREKDICSVFHYVPLHSAPAGKKFGRFSGEDVYTTKESERLMRLPMFYNLDMEDAKRVVDAIASFDGF